MKYFTILLVSILILTSQLAHSADTPKSTYLGVGFGFGGYYAENTPESQIDDIAFYKLDLYGGWQFHPNVALELGAGGGIFIGWFTTTEASTYYADLIGNYPLSQRVKLLGSVGIARVAVEQSDIFSQAGLYNDATETTVAGKLGTGFEYDILTEYKVDLSLRLKANYYIANSQLVDSTVGFVVKF